MKFIPKIETWFLRWWNLNSAVLCTLINHLKFLMRRWTAQRQQNIMTITLWNKKKWTYLIISINWIIKQIFFSRKISKSSENWMEWKKYDAFFVWMSNRNVHLRLSCFFCFIVYRESTKQFKVCVQQRIGVLNATFFWSMNFALKTTMTIVIFPLEKKRERETKVHLKID